MNDLVVCEACHRHVKAKDLRCPFCSHTVSARNAALCMAGAIVVGVGLSLAACGDQASGGGGDVPAYGPPIHTGGAGSGGGAIAAYGPPSWYEDAGYDGGMASAVYAAPALDSGK